MTNVERHNINLVALERLAVRGVTRAAVFMGLGLNAAQRDDFKEYELSKVPIDASTNHTPVTLVPPGANAATVCHYKSEFASWIISAGLSEVLEHYALLLTHLHYHALIVYRARQKGQHFGNFEAAQRNFVESSGLSEKINQLFQRFEISTDFDHCIRSLYKLRNAITHNFGFIAPKQAKEGVLRVEWYAFEFFLSTNDGVPVPLRPMVGEAITPDAKITLKRLKREYRLHAGTRINLSREQLEEICLFFSAGCIPAIKASFIRFLNRHQVPMIPVGAKERPDER